MWSGYWNEKCQRKPKNWREKPPQCPLQIQHNLTWSWTRTTMEGSLVGGERRPAPWPMSRSTALKLNWGSCCYRRISRDLLRWSLKDGEGKEKDLSWNEFWHLYRQTGLIRLHESYTETISDETLSFVSISTSASVNYISAFYTTEI